MYKIIFLGACVVLAHAQATNEDNKLVSTKPDSVNKDAGNSSSGTTEKDVQSTSKVSSTAASSTSLTAISIDLDRKLCTLANGVQGQCVPFYLCNYSLAIKQDEDFYFSLRIPMEDPCDNSIDVCCLPSEMIPSTTSKPEIQPPTNDTGPDNRSGTTGKDVQSTTEVQSTSSSATSIAATAASSVLNSCGEKGECVPYYLCNYTKPSELDLIDIHIPTKVPCSNPLEVCCSSSDVIPSPTSKPEGQPPTNDTGPDNRIGTTRKDVQSTTEVQSTSSSATSITATAASSVLNSCGERGECVPYYLCNYTKPLDVGLIDIHVHEEDCENYLEVCCLPSDRILSSTAKPEKPTQWEPCGHINKELVKMPVAVDTSKFATFGELPWMIAVFKWEPVNKSEPDGEKQKIFVGGGSLIHPSIVLTAAHIVGGKEMSVRAGEWDTMTKNEQYPYQERSVKEVVLHDEYIKASLHHDVALLFLSSPFAPAPHISIACLLSENDRMPNTTRCWTSGWGKDSFEREGSYQNVLKKFGRAAKSLSPPSLP